MLFRSTEGARQALTDFWEFVADAARLSPFQATPIDMALGNWSLAHSPAFVAMDMLSRLASPYTLNPAGINPLLRVLDRVIDFDRLRAAPIKLFVTATNVRTGRGRVFRNADLSPQVLLASACLPTLFRAVEICDPDTGALEAFWDGGFTGNPAMFPLYDQSLPRDIVIVNINPLLRDGIPRTPAQIADRVNEVSFNASLMADLRAINFVKRLFAEDRLQNRTMKNPLVHMILDDVLMNDLTARSKLMPAPGLLARMKEAGQVAADSFLAKHADALNRRDTVDLPALFAGSGVIGA